MSVLDNIKDFFYRDDSEEMIDSMGDNPYGTDEIDLDVNSARPFDHTRTTAIDEGVTSGVSVTSGSSIEMKVIRPEKLDGSVTQIADYLINKNTVLLNLEATNKETARRLLDFLNGVAYAVNGKLKKVANSTFVITPSNVSISGENIVDSSDHEAI